MIRTGLPAAIIVVAVGLAVSAAHAQSPPPPPPPDTEDSRFTFHRSEDGYLRLDGRSGQVSLCARKPAGWLCQAVADERSALEAEIARLQSDNAALKKELLSRNLPLPGAIKPDPPTAKTDEPRLQLPSDADLNRMMAFMEKVWRRLVEMIVNAQRDIQKKL